MHKVQAPTLIELVSYYHECAWAIELLGAVVTAIELVTGFELLSCHKQSCGQGEGYCDGDQHYLFHCDYFL